jgi:hypothetical protein
VKVVACADIKAPLAKAKAEKYGVAAMSVDGLLASDEVDTVINLDSRRPLRRDASSILPAERTPTEKPLALSAAAAKKLVAEADRGVSSAARRIPSSAAVRSSPGA